MPTTGITFGLTPDSKMRLRDERGHWARFDADNVVRVREGLDAIAVELAMAVKHEFIKGGHNTQAGILPEGWPRSIDTIQVEQKPLGVTVKMTGGAFYVETGSVPHLITVSSHASGTNIAPSSPFGTLPRALHWVGGTFGAGDHFAITVHHPGYKGDDFLGRAMHASELDTQIGRLGYSMYAKKASFKALPTGVTKA